MYNDDFLTKKLNERKDVNAFRSLKLVTNKIDFCSNDYLGIVKNNLLQINPHNLSFGATGSRLLSGNYPLAEETEKLIAHFHDAEAALIFNSGYDANVGALSSIPQRSDVVFYDQYSHASIRDGLRLSFAKSLSFLHNNPADLEIKLGALDKNYFKNIFIVTESVFSMDGDTCPLNEILLLCKKYNAHLILDEAHAIGVIGNKGEGLAQHLKMHSDVFCRIYTYGKACGVHGASVCGTAQLKDYLINFSRSFIYTTALSPHAVAAINSSYKTFPFLNNERNYLKKIVEKFKMANVNYKKTNSDTPIQIIMVAGNDNARALANKLQENNLDVRAILYPTVAKGEERLRIVLHSFNTEKEIDILLNCLAE